MKIPLRAGIVRAVVVQSLFECHPVLKRQDDNDQLPHQRTPIRSPRGKEEVLKGTGENHGRGHMGRLGAELGVVNEI